MTRPSHPIYTLRNEAVAREIIDPIETGDALAAEYNIDAIADQIITHYAGETTDSGDLNVTHAGFHTTVDDPDEFWRIVEDHALTEFTLHHTDNADEELDYQRQGAHHEVTGPTGRPLLSTRILGHDEEEVDRVDYAVADPEDPTEWAEACTAALRDAGWQVTSTLTTHGGTVTRP